jgi:hypothetical protein
VAKYLLQYHPELIIIEICIISNIISTMGIAWLENIHVVSVELSLALILQDGTMSKDNILIRRRKRLIYLVCLSVGLKRERSEI